MNREKANKIRAELAKLSDQDLLSFKAAVYAGEAGNSIPFESVGDYVKRTAESFFNHIPF